MSTCRGILLNGSDQGATKTTNGGAHASPEAELKVTTSATNLGPDPASSIVMPPCSAGPLRQKTPRTKGVYPRAAEAAAGSRYTPQVTPAASRRNAPSYRGAERCPSRPRVVARLPDSQQGTWQALSGSDRCFQAVRAQGDVLLRRKGYVCQSAQVAVSVALPWAPVRQADPSQVAESSKRGGALSIVPRGQ
jgi:hypothetical protein